MTKTELFEKLAKPDDNGCSRWVSVSEFTGDYIGLKLGNGLSWGRKNSPLSKKYIIEVDKSITPGNSVDAVRLKGFNNEKTFNQNIRKDIKDYYKNKNCVMLGINGNSENTKIEIDHKDGRKNNIDASEMESQKLEDFQPLCKAANDCKRQICKVCRETDKRWDAKNLSGNPYSFYFGDENYTDELGCIGCYQYDPVAYRKETVKRISRESSEHTAEFIMEKLYGKEP